MVAAALLNFGVNGVEYAIQLHLMQFNTDATLIGAIGSGIAAMMLVGAFAAARLSDRVPVGVCICVSFVFLCACVAPMLFAYGPGVSDGASYALVFVANSVMGLPFPIIDALLPVLGFRGTIAVFLAALALSTVIVLCSARIRRIPRVDGWDTAEL